MKNPVRFNQVLIAFALFLGIHLLIIPAILLTFFDYTLLDTYSKMWLNLLGVVAFVTSLLIYLSFNRKILWWFFGRAPGLKAYLMGAASIIIGYPLVLATTQLLTMFVEDVLGAPHVDQVAVQQLKQAIDDPILFRVLLIAVVFIIPFLEEALFRGFLQTWLRNYFNPALAIFTTSVIFAAFHFSTLQGWHNISILGPLFALSCLMGYLYERYKNLFASLGLHSTFNALSALAILYTN